MLIIMHDTITESLNDGRTTQDFQKDRRYDVPAAIGQSWIARGWAHAAATSTKPERRATNEGRS